MDVAFLIESAAKVLVILVFVLLAVVLTTWMERKVLGHMQDRIGPDRVGTFGILQSIADGLKLDCLEVLAAEEGAALFREELESFLRSNRALGPALALVAYMRELGRRSAFRGQGRPVLALWREFAWKDRRPIKNFELTAQEVLQAEAYIRKKLA